MANTIIINGQRLPYPKSFKMEKTPNIACELETMSGKRIADVNGWRYADTSIEWGALYPEDLKRLVAATADPSFKITFHTDDGEAMAVNAILRSFTRSRTLVQYGDDFVWEGVGINVSFPDCYQY